MATVRKNRSGNWEAQIRRKGIPPITETFPTKREADAFAADMESRIARGKSVASPDAYTVGQALEEYAASIAVSVIDADGKETKKVDSRKAAYLNGLLPHFGQFSIGFLRSKNIKKFVDLMRTTPVPRPNHAKKAHPLYAGSEKKFYAESTIRKFVYALKSALDYHASQHGYTYDLHLFSDKKPSSWGNVRKRRLCVVDNEEQRIIDACRHVMARDKAGNVINKRERKHGETYAGLVSFLVATAARLQEALLAEWNEFNLERRLWTIPSEHIKTEKNKRHPESRRVPLSETAISVLRKLKEDQPKSSGPFLSLPKGKAIFVTWKRICKDAQVSDLHFHDFRHEAIARWVVKGGHDIEISKVAGHDIKVMQDYVSYRDEELKEFSFIN